MKARRIVKLFGLLWVVDRDFHVPIAGGMPFTAVQKNLMLDTLDGAAPFVGAHSAWPGDAGANELAGVPYARQALAWGAAAGGSKASANAPAIPIPAGATVAFLGLWSLVTAGTFRGWAARAGGVPAPFETTAADDVFRCDQTTLADGNQVFLMDTSGAVLPGGFTEGTIYFVRDKTTDTFKLALTAGGAAIDVSADGAGFVQTITPQTYATVGTETVSSTVFDLLR